MPLTLPLNDVEPYHTSGLYYCPQAHPVAGALTLNQVNCSPIYLRAGSWDRIAVYVTSFAGAGGVVRLGVYYDNGSGFPGALAFDAGPVVTTTPAQVREITIDQSLGSGLFWTACVAQVASCSVVCCQVTAVTPRPMGFAAPIAGTVSAFFKASVTGALPDPFGGTVTNVVTSAIAPVVWLRRV